MKDLISRKALCEYALNQKDKSVTPNDIMRFPPTEPETFEEKLKEIADRLSEKFAYLDTCPNERDIILGYLGVKRTGKIHCDTDCTKSECKSNHHYKKSLTESETSRIENALHGKSPEEQYDFIWWLLQSYAMNFTDSRQAAIEWLKGEAE